MWHLHDRNTGAFILLNSFDTLHTGVVEEALQDAAVSDRDKARLEYYLGYIHFNRGREKTAIEHYDRALGYEVSDAVQDTAQYAKAYALGALYDGEGAFDKAVEAYWAYLDVHAYGRVPDYALYGLGRIYSRAGDLAGARYFYEYIVEQYPGSELTALCNKSLSRELADVAQQQARRSGTPGDAPAFQLCGPVALQKWLAQRGVAVTPRELAAKARMTAEGASMQGLCDAAAAYGLELVGVQSVRGAGLETPFIAFVNGNHFVLVRDSNANAVLVDDIHDEAAQWIPRETFYGCWDGKALISGAQPIVAQRLDMESMVGARGGQDPMPDPNNMECRNGELCCKCDECPAPLPATQPTAPGLNLPGGRSPLICGVIGCFPSGFDASSTNFGNPGPGGPSTGTTNPSSAETAFKIFILLQNGILASKVCTTF